MLEATTEYRRESDQVGRFLSERCVSGKEQSVSGNALYSAYVEFCQKQGEKYLANNLFAAQITKRHIEKKRTVGDGCIRGWDCSLSPADGDEMARGV